MKANGHTIDAAGNYVWLIGGDYDNYRKDGPTTIMVYGSELYVIGQSEFPCRKKFDIAQDGEVWAYDQRLGWRLVP